MTGGIGAAGIRVVVADDQAIVRDGLVTLLGVIDGIEVVGEAADGDAAIRVVALQRPDVILMDLRMPVLDGVGATRRITADYPATSVLVLTTFADDDSIRLALEAGARGYLTKDAGRAQLEAGIRSAASGQTTLAPEVSERLIAALAARSDPAADALDDVRRAFPALTNQQAHVALLLGRGLSNPQIASELFVTVATVKSHVNAIFAKLGSASRLETIDLIRASIRRD